MSEKTQDCTVCIHRGPHPAAAHAGQVWYCNRNKFWVGDRVTNCTHHRRASGRPEGSKATAVDAVPSKQREDEGMPS